MRPLELTLSGLHSYREPVTIDFTDLGRYGLFGIFGKIGSGKSTILDAITLALFGVVDRVSTRAREGLVHLGAERCEVRFSFAIGGETYEVQRSYREVDGVAQRVGSRVVAIEGSHRTTLADKEGEVQQTVTNLVGLGPDDFTRAVVLPQGKFQQLLHLRGQDRRLMLQRIFRLQAYGEGLRRQVRERREVTSRALAAVEGEMVGLGDASPEAVRRAEADAIEARRLRNEAERAAERLQAEHDAAVLAREQHRRYVEARQTLDAHLETRGAHEARVALLEQADRLRPLLAPAERWLAATDRAAFANEAAAAASRDAMAAAADLALAQADFDALRAEHAAQDPARRARLSRLEQVEGEERALAADRLRAEEVEAEIRAGEGALSTAEHRLAEVRSAGAALEVDRRKMRREHNQIRVPPGEREALAAAVRAAERVAAARARVDEAQHERTRAVQAREAAAHEVAVAEESLYALRAAHVEASARLADAKRDPALLPDETRERLARRVVERTAAEREIARANDLLARADEARVAAEQARVDAEADLAAANEILAGAERALTEAESALSRAAHRTTVADLAADLVPGQPCPVCGSREHPRRGVETKEPPVPPENVLRAAVEAHRTGRKQARSKVDEALTRAARAEAALYTLRKEIDQAEGELAAAITSLGEHQDPATGETAARALAAHEEALARLVAAQEAHRLLELDLERRGTPLAAARGRHEGAERQLARLVQILEARQQEAGEAWAAFDRERGPYTLLALGSAQVGLEQRDRRAEQLHEQLETVEARLHALESEMVTARDDVAKARLLVERARERAVALSEQIDARSTLVSSELGDSAGSARVLADTLRTEIESAEDRLAAVARIAASATQRADEARRTADARAADARAAAAEHEASDRAFGEALARAGMARPDRATAERWLATCPDAATVQSWRAEVERWRDQALVLEARLAAVRSGLAESGLPTEGLDDETFGSGSQPGTVTALAARLAIAVDHAERARSSAIGATRHHDELVVKAERYRQLGERAATVGLEATQLDTLTNVLRGDKFVEFVANDHLADLTARGSEHLERLSDGRYRLALDGELSFVVRDREHGSAATRPVHSLSGGETFLASLALALALSEQVQQRTARPLGFFFLDEGFGTLDPEALDRVLTAIERLRDDTRLIGLISHVAEIRERVPRYLWVHRDEGSGSRVEVCGGPT